MKITVDAYPDKAVHRYENISRNFAFSVLWGYITGRPVVLNVDRDSLVKRGLHNETISY